MKNLFFLLLFVTVSIFTSCESEIEKQARLKLAEEKRIELAQERKEAERIRLEKEKEKRIELETKLERERKEKELYDRYINNSLQNGATPYSYCYGGNRSCTDYGCSEIKVRTPHNSDVLVLIKKNNKVIRHAFIKAGRTFTFEIPNGTYQPFFYYGKGWNPDKYMKPASCGSIIGGFIIDESFGKDSPQYLNNSILTYELVLQKNGNFRTKQSNLNEAL